MKIFKRFYLPSRPRSLLLFPQPFVAAITAHREVEKHDKLDLLKDAISLPGLTMKFLMKNIDTSQGDFFTTFGADQKDIAELIERSVRGGASVVFRYFFYQFAYRLSEI